VTHDFCKVLQNKKREARFMSELFSDSSMVYLVWIHLALIALAPIILIYRMEKDDIQHGREDWGST